MRRELRSRRLSLQGRSGVRSSIGMLVGGSSNEKRDTRVGWKRSKTHLGHVALTMTSLSLALVSSSYVADTAWSKSNLAIRPASLATAYKGAAYRSSITVPGLRSRYVLRITHGRLPPGLVLLRRGSL